MTTRTLLASSMIFAAASALAAGFRAAPSADYKPDAFSFAAEFNTVAVAGEAREHVFAPKSAAEEYAADLGLPVERRRHQVSRLDWDLAASMIGFAGSVRYDRLSLNAGAWYGGSGSDDWEMKDYDWLAGDHVGYTEYSRSDAEVTDAWMFDANIAYDFWRAEAFAAYAFAGFRWQRWEWECDGWNDFWYSDNNWNRVREKGHVCDYRQTLYFGYIGVGGIWKLSDALDFSAYLSWAPAYAGKDRDKHLAAEKDFKETFDYDDGNVYAAGVALNWRVAQAVTLSLTVDWQKATLHEGDMNLNNYGEGEHDEMEDGAGYENEYVALTLGVALAF